MGSGHAGTCGSGSITRLASFVAELDRQGTSKHCREKSEKLGDLMGRTLSDRYRVDTFIGRERPIR